VQAVAQFLGQGVALLRPRHGDGGDAFARLDFDQAHFQLLRRSWQQGSSRPYLPHQESPMQTRNPFFDDLSKMANGAMGALTGVKDEMEARFRDQIAKILDGMDIPRRDEFEAVKAMAAKAREQN